MKHERWVHLMRSEDPLTKEEIAEGWHFCHDFDGLLVGPEMGEQEICTCEGVPKQPNQTDESK